MQSKSGSVTATTLGVERKTAIRGSAGTLGARPKLWLTRVILILADALALVAASFLARVVWRAFQPATPVDASTPFLIAIPVIIIGFAFMSLYPGIGVSPVLELRRVSLYVTAVMATTVVVLFLTGNVGGASRGAWLLTWGFSLAAVPLTRALVRHVFSGRPWWGAAAVVLGAGKTAELVIDRTKQLPGMGLKVVACFDDDPAKQGTEVLGVPVLGPVQTCAAMQRTHGWRAKYAIFAMPGVEPSRLTTLMQQYGRVFPHVLVIPNIFGFSSVGVGVRDIGGVVAVYNRQNLLITHNKVFKRLMDLVLLVPAGLFGSALAALGALGVFLVDRKNPFMYQLREGKGGKPFKVWKIRTMRVDADAYLERYLAEHPEAREEWERHFKLTDDPRVLPVVGKFLRRTSVDELPQLLNILLGEMSFVGPRPFPYYHLEGFSAEFRELRTSVTPGLTGYWQVTSRSTADLALQEALDTYYISNWSVWLDVYILARTPWAVLFGKGAY